MTTYMNATDSTRAAMRRKMTPLALTLGSN